MPIKPAEQMPQRDLAIRLRLACYMRDAATIRALVAANPRGARSSHVLHNLSAKARAYLDAVIEGRER